MHKELQSFARQFAKQANLGDSATKDIYRELLADLDAKYRELMLNGKNSVQALKLIKEEFGASEELAFELHKVHYPLMRIPLLGELLYYRPFLVAGYLAVSYLLVYLLGLSLLPELIYKIFPGVWLSSTWVWIVTLSLQFMSGIIAYRWSQSNWRLLLEAMAMSVVPYLWINLLLVPLVSALGSSGLAQLFLVYFLLYLLVNMAFVSAIIPLHKLIIYLRKLR